MTVIEMIQSWLQFTNYDPESTSCTISNDPLTNTYEMRRCNERIAEILNGYDKNGEVALIYAKNMFLWMMKNSKVKMWDFLDTPDMFAKYKKMYDMFTSSEFLTMERSYLISFNHLLETILGTKMIGESDSGVDSEILYNSVDNVLECLTKCKLTVHKVGGGMYKLTNVGANIRVFDLLSECLITLETVPDGVYICYITANNTVDGYFSIFLKSNGNLISINDRIDEAYQGEHSRARNNRHIENKKYELFPYTELVEYSGSDYKGYATRSTVAVKEYAIKQLSAERICSLILAMSLLARKYENAVFSRDQVVYVDSMLPQNLNSEVFKLTESCTDLVATNSSSLVAFHNEYSVDFTSEDIKSGKPSERFGYKAPNTEWNETGGFVEGANQILVDLWGEGFELDTTELLNPNLFLRRIGMASGEEAAPVEFVGRKVRMDMAAYMQARRQLAKYMEDKIYEEFCRIDGWNWAEKWWKDQIKKNQDKWIQMAAAFIATKDRSIIREMNYHITENVDYPSCWGCGISVPNSQFIAYRPDPREWKWKCPVTGNMSNYWIAFEPKDYKDLEFLIGEEVPKILKGWMERGHDCHVNQNINAHDPVEMVGTPYERNSRDPRYFKNGVVSIGSFGYGADTFHSFTFAIGFSKRGINKLVTQYKNQHQ